MSRLTKKFLDYASRETRQQTALVAGMISSRLAAQTDVIVHPADPPEFKAKCDANNTSIARRSCEIAIEIVDYLGLIDQDATEDSDKMQCTFA